jgi:hypothetical protein
MLFEKAISEGADTYLYAKLANELSGLQVLNALPRDTFKKQFISRCQFEFESEVLKDIQEK